MLRIMAPSISTVMLLLLPLVLLVPVVLIVYPNDFAALQALMSSPTCQYNATDVVGVAVDFRLLIGVLTLPGRYERRNLIRTVYALQQASLPAARVVHVRFVFCRVASEEVRVLVALESMRHGDVVELDCEENMDSGKTYSYFSSVPALFAGDSAYDFVMKADDDTFLRLPQLSDALARGPKEDLYYGCRVPCHHRRPANEYMSGMGYVLSWDLVEWIAAADMIRNRTAGPEDRTLRRWFGLGDGGKAKNWVDAKPAMYDFPGDPKDTCAHELVPDTVAVHKLKNTRGGQQRSTTSTSPRASSRPSSSATIDDLKG